MVGSGNSYSTGDTGGEAKVTLTVNEMPPHNHLLGVTVSNTGTAWRAYRGAKETADNNVRTENTGGGQPHNNLPPYLAVNIWKRTA